MAHSKELRDRVEDLEESISLDGNLGRDYFGGVSGVFRAL